MYAAAMVFSMAIACGENQAGNNNGNDTAPGVVVPPVPDTSGVVTTPPVNDSMSVNSDSQEISR